MDGYRDGEEFDYDGFEPVTPAPFYWSFWRVWRVFGFREALRVVLHRLKGVE